MSILQALGRWTGGTGPLYLRLATALRAAIERGDLAPGTRLPPERALAQTLAVSRSTVVAAYDQLRQEGLLESRQGSGTWIPGGGSRALRQIVPLAEPRPIDDYPMFRALLEGPSAAVSLTAACALGGNLVAEAAGDVVRDDLPALLQTSGYAPLGLPAFRAGIAARFEELGVPTNPEEVIATSGAQQAIALLARLLVQRGDAIVIESPTYPGAIDVFAQAGARLVPVPVDRDGVGPEALRQAVASASPRAIYLVPTFHNPTGAVMPEHRRREIAAIASEFRVPIIEDNTLADLSFEEEPPAPLPAFGASAPVYSIGSVSKLFWGGLRVGWVRAPEPVISRLARIKTVHDLGSPTIGQAIVTRLLPRMEEAKRLRRAQLTERLGLLERALHDYLPGWTWVRPRGGSFLWVRMPHGDAAEFARLAIRYGVELVPGSSMLPEGGVSQHMRIPFIHEPEVIEDGVKRISHAWHAYAPGLQARRQTVDVLV